MKKILVVLSLIVGLIVGLVVVEEKVAESAVVEQRAQIAMLEEAEAKETELDHYVDKENVSYMLYGMTIKEAEEASLKDNEVIGVTKDFEESTLEYGLVVFDYESNQVGFKTVEDIKADIQSIKMNVCTTITGIFSLTILVVFCLSLIVIDKIDDIKKAKERAARKAELEATKEEREAERKALEEAIVAENKELLTQYYEAYAYIVDNELVAPDFMSNISFADSMAKYEINSKDSWQKRIMLGSFRKLAEGELYSSTSAWWNR